MTMQPENENKDEAEQKVSKDELSEKELEKTTGGDISFSFGKLKTDYKTQNSDGSSGT